MGDASLGKFESVVLGFIQAHDVGHSKVFKHLQIVFWGITATVKTYLVDGSHEGNVLLWNDPVQITIFNFLVVLIFLVVELSEVIPAETDGDLEPLQTMKDRAAVRAITITGISERSEASLVRSKGFPCNLSRLP